MEEFGVAQGPNDYILLAVSIPVVMWEFFEGYVWQIVDCQFYLSRGSTRLDGGLCCLSASSYSIMQFTLI